MKLIDAMDEPEAMQAAAAAGKKGQKGLKCGCPATVLDAGELIDKYFK